MFERKHTEEEQKELDRFKKICHIDDDEDSKAICLAEIECCLMAYLLKLKGSSSRTIADGLVCSHSVINDQINKGQTFYMKLAPLLFVVCKAIKEDTELKFQKAFKRYKITDLKMQKEIKAEAYQNNNY